MNHRFTTAANFEFVNSALYYESQREGLGLEFADEVDRGVECHHGGLATLAGG